MKQGQIDELYNRVTEAEAITQQVINKMAVQKARIEALEAALRDAEKEWVVSEIKLLNRIIEMIDAPHNYRRKHISDEIGLAIAALAPEQDK